MAWDLTNDGPFYGVDDRPPVAAQQVGGVKPLDLSTLLRDAFLAGRGLKDGDKLSEEDQAAWMEYDPERMAAYQRISAALYGSSA